MGKVELKLPLPLKSVAALPCENQVVNYTALQHISVQNEVKTFNYGKCSRIMLFLCFFTQINSLMCLKCLPSAYMRVLSGECHWSMNASIVRCSMLCQTFFFITETSNATNNILH